MAELFSGVARYASGHFQSGQRKAFRIAKLRKSRIVEDMQTVVETPSYLAGAKAAGMSEEVRTAIVDAVAVDPSRGVALRGTGGCRKFRFAEPGRGKSGGYRIIHFFTGPDIPVFLLAVFTKAEKDNITDAEAHQLATLTRRLVDAHRVTAAKQETRP